MKRRRPWLLMVPLMAAGCIGAHSVAYWFFEPAPARDHGFLLPAPLVLAIGVALGAVAALRSALAEKSQAGGPVYLFALLPPLAFTLQEHVESALVHGAPGVETALEPTFLAGLVLQLPFALCAVVVARGLAEAADAAVGRLLRRSVATRKPPVSLPPPSTSDAPRSRAPASPQAERAPPLAA